VRLRRSGSRDTNATMPALASQSATTTTMNVRLYRAKTPKNWSLVNGNPPPDHIESAVACAVAGRPNRSYRIGTTTMLRAVELSRPNMITIAMGA
jgi:hypothetical protein